MRIVVLGGSGFVGHHLLPQLSRHHHQITVVVPRVEQHRSLRLIPNVHLLEGRYLTDLVLRKAMKNQDVVINLLGCGLQDTSVGYDIADFIQLTKKVLSACEVEGVERLIHLSALGVRAYPADHQMHCYAQVEALVQQAHLKTTIFRPSMMFGAQDQFIESMESLLDKLPWIAVVHPDQQLSPIWVGDVVHALVQSLQDTTTIGQCYDLCGQRRYRLLELWQLVAQMRRKSTHFIALPRWCSQGVTWIANHCPWHSAIRTVYRGWQLDGDCQCSFPYTRPLLSIRGYLAQSMSGVRRRYDQLRQTAGR